MGFLYSQFFVTPQYPTTSFEGQTVIVTGSNVGLGKEAARHVTRLGAAKVILAVRNTKAGEEARTDIVSSTKCDPKVVEVWSLDLSSYKSVKAFADRASQLPRIDVLLENAGIATGKFDKVPESGHERTITVNVISTFLLALLLVPKLKADAKKFGIKPRITIVSSEVHAWTDMPEWKEPNTFEALSDPATADMGKRYPTSKLLEVLVIREIAPKLAGSGVIINMLNPGLCHSELSRDSGWGLTIMKAIMARTTEVGSRTLVAAAEAGPESHGKYMTDAQVDDGALSKFVTSEDGKKAGQKVWRELKVILEEIDSGVTKGF